MPEVTYENIQANLVSAKQDGSSMRCSFKCPVSGETVESSGGIQKGRGLGDMARHSVKRNLFSQVRWGIARAIRSALGYGLAGRVAGDVAGTAVGNAMNQHATSFSEEEKKVAVVQAFENIQSRFVWDAKNDRWMSAQAAGDVLTDFASQLNRAPVTQTYDKGVLARMLMEVSLADGQLAAEEKSFLASFMPAETGGVDVLRDRPPLSGAELAETGKGPVRETMLMIAWGLAFTDKNLAPAEKSALARFAGSLGIDDSRAAELQNWAKKFIFDQAMDGVYVDAKPDQAARAEAYRLAEQIGLDHAEAERVEIRYRKRNGLI
jgi:uncharacterized tellurite resistance protein B-like protein